MANGKLFGTDGIRGEAGKFLSADLALKAARGLCSVLKSAQAGAKSGRPQIVVGMDPRLSSPMLSSAVNSGIVSAGFDAVNLGVVPTPLVPFAISRLRAAGGVMVTASHNPIEDNGLKFFGPDSFKLSSAAEARIEKFIGSDTGNDMVKGPYYGSISRESWAEKYLKFLKSAVRPPKGAKGIKVVLDCAHGATAELAPQAFMQAGFKVSTICDTFDGSRINIGCGATSLDRLKREVLKHKANMGFAFDGDGDRVLAVDELGHEVTGDKIIALFATRLPRYRKQGGAVMTKMTNMGVEDALKGLGVKLERMEVGDINVLKGMRTKHIDLGGEQSGHILMLDKSPAGDGILSGLQLASVMAAAGKPLSWLAGAFPEYPQRLVNIRVQDKEACLKDKQLARQISAVHKAYRDVRFYLRPSGTENVVRVLTESRSRERCEASNDEVCGLIRRWDAG